MPGFGHDRFLRATALTRYAVRVSVLLMAGTATFLVWRYPSLPGLLPVHFRSDGLPNGWQFRTLPRVLMPVFVQLALFAMLGSIGALLLSRRDAGSVGRAPDVQAAHAAAEAVMLIAAIWVGFQAYAAVALANMWVTVRPTLGRGYTRFELAGVILTGIVGVRARARIGRPGPPAYVAAHWRYGQLYCNREDPALFVPTRNGHGWTMNFGRPSAVVLLAGLLTAGVVLPVAILTLALRA